MNKKCDNDKLFVKPIEICSYNALNELKTTYPDDSRYNVDSNIIFNKELIDYLPDLKNNFRKDQKDNDYDYKNEGDTNKNKNLCNLTNKIDEYYMNCVIKTKNPFFTYKDGYCLVSPEINLPKQLKKVEDKDEIIIKLDKKFLEDEEGNFNYQKVKNNKYCEDRWYDWIIIPNYHLGNRILKDSGAYNKEDVKVCYDNCREGELPYISSAGKKLCVPKEIAYDGIYETKLDYSPLALINLICNNKKKLNLLFKNLYVYKLNKKFNKYTINNEVKFTEEINNEDNYVINEVFEKIKNILHKIVNENNLDIFDYSFDYKNLTYKHPYFKEDDLITLMGLDKNEILSNDIILIHTAYLAYNIYEFNDNIINNTDYFNDSNNVNIDKHKNHEFNINKIIIDFDNDNKSFANDIRYRQRLANILYKAINICYDNKTDFSKNLIKRTEEAFKKYNLKSLSINNISFTEDDIKKYKDFISSKTQNIINGFEIKYYIRSSIIELFNNYKDRFDIISFITNYLLYTEEYSELINQNKCETGSFPNNNRCVKCDDVCNSKFICSNTQECSIYCETNCKKINDDNEKTICGGTTKEDEINNIKEKKDEIKTPIEEETIMPDFSYIFKNAIKFFFILITLYIAYMFYKMFNESILTLGNILYGFIDSIFYLFSNKIKVAEHYEDIIKYKYNTVIRKTTT